MKKAYLEITMKVSGANRPKAGAVYAKYKPPFLATVRGAESKDLLLREEDVQVLHRFASRAAAESYLTSTLFGNDVVGELKPFLMADPEVRIYECQ
jgi:Holliday junction resolvase